MHTPENSGSLDGQRSKENLGELSTVRAPTISYPGAKVVTAYDFALEHLRALISGPELAIVIPSFIASDTAQAVGTKLEELPLITRYRNLRDDLFKIGHTLFEAVSECDPIESEQSNDMQSEALARYLSNAETFRTTIRNQSRLGGEAPFDRVTELLSTIGDSRALTIGGRPAFAGLVRVLSTGQAILPHQDLLGEDLPRNHLAKELAKPGAGQLAGNIYLRMPPSGGELAIWEHHLTLEERLALKAQGSDYGVDLNKVRAPDLLIKPQPGDLIFFNSRKLHSVLPVREGTRVSLSFFVGLTQQGQIRYWS